MRGRPPVEWIGAAAGAVLIVLVFLPWWKLDAGAGSSDAAVRGYLDLFSQGDVTASAWDAVPRTALVWLAAGAAALAAAGAQALQAGVLVRRWVLTGAAAAGALALALWCWRLVVDSPLDSYAAQPAAYGAVTAMIVLTACAIARLRRA